MANWYIAADVAVAADTTVDAADATVTKANAKAVATVRATAVADAIKI